MSNVYNCPLQNMISHLIDHRMIAIRPMLLLIGVDQIIIYYAEVQTQNAWFTVEYI